MSVEIKKQDFTEKLQQLGAGNQNNFSIDEIYSIVNTILSTMTGDISSTSVKIYTELEGLADYIHKAKQEIASIRPDQIKDKHIKTATDELDAVVDATAEATGTILDQAEKVQNLAAQIGGPNADQLVECVTKIFEACNFQDITGQRITKVVTVLKHIEETLDTILKTFGDIGKYMQEDHSHPKQLDQLTDKDLLNGPQKKTEAKTQDEIDALFGS